MEKAKHVRRAAKGNLTRTLNARNMLLEAKKISNMPSKRDVASEIPSQFYVPALVASGLDVYSETPDLAPPKHRKEGQCKG